MGTQRKVEKRCPVCGEFKLMEARSETCSISCGAVYRKQKLAEKASAPVYEPQEGHRIIGDTWEISLPKTRIKTLDELIAACKVNLEEWQVERFIVNKWEVGALVEKSGRIEVEPLYQVKAWLKRKRDVILAREEIARMREEAKRWMPKLRPAKATPGDVMLEIAVSDLHVGRYAWGDGTGCGDYDSKIAIQRLNDAVAAMIERSKPMRPAKILMLVGNDLFNIDNLQNTTTQGTRQDTDTRYQKLFAEVRRAYVDLIGMALTVAPVHVIVVPGNHDTLSSWHLGDSLSLWFSRSPGVTVDNAPVPRKYYQWGKVGLMFCHGDKGKRINYPMVFASERPDIFGECVWKEVHTGHWHHTIAEDRYGVMVRVLPTLAAQSHWESENMYIGSIRAAEAFLWHKELGLLGTLIHAVPRGKEEQCGGSRTTRKNGA